MLPLTRPDAGPASAPINAMPACRLVKVSAATERASLLRLNFLAARSGASGRSPPAQSGRSLRPAGKAKSGRSRGSSSKSVRGLACLAGSRRPSLYLAMTPGRKFSTRHIGLGGQCTAWPSRPSLAWPGRRSTLCLLRFKPIGRTAHRRCGPAGCSGGNRRRRAAPRP